MNWRVLTKLLGFFSCVVAVLIGVSAAISLFYQEKEAFWLGVSALVPMAGGLGLMQISWESDIEDISHRDATLLTALSWVLAIFWGSFPYFLSKAFGDFSALSYLNSLFESTSGFTATAASVLIPVADFDNLPHGLFFWRALSQWLGGLGIILIALMFLPFIRSGGMELYQTSSIARERMRTRVGKTSRSVLFIYLGLTVMAVTALHLGGMNLFDALCHGFSTISTGGFSTHALNIRAYNNPTIEIILMVFMLLATTNFALHFSFVRQEWGVYWRSTELRFYLSVLVIAALLIGWNLHMNGLESGWREAAFNTVSIGTTTGFWNANLSLWPSFSKAVLISLMFMGGMVGTPSGAIKVFRVTLLIKYAYRQIFRIIHPAGFTPVKSEGRVVDKEVLEGVAAFFILYMMIFAVASLIMQAIGYKMVVATSAVASTLGGVGPAFYELGITGGYYAVPVVGKITLMVCMLLGRVEIFPILVILSREFWRK